MAGRGKTLILIHSATDEPFGNGGGAFSVFIVVQGKRVDFGVVQMINIKLCRRLSTITINGACSIKGWYFFE
ncbi:MAG: hypothetical protein LBQ60_12435 [Bacteroidales bacterium]|nr:hypothetical protein [Bacteroidales bacterium]